MSKLGSLIAIPVSFALVKAIVNRIPEDTTPIVPIIPVFPKDSPFYDDLILRQKDKPVVTPPVIPTGPIKQPSADIPKFVPFDILGGPTIDKSKLLPPDFTFTPFTGLLSPEAQANIKRYQEGLK